MRVKLPFNIQQQLDSLLLKILPASQPATATTTAPVQPPQVKISPMAQVLQQFMATANTTPVMPNTQQAPLPQHIIKQFITAHANPLTPETLQDKLEAHEPPATAFTLHHSESWPLVMIPFHTGEKQQWITIRYYREPKKDHPESETISHFDIALDFPSWGHIQFTGRHRTGYLGLSIKHKQALPQALQDEIKTLFYHSIKGEIVFDNVKELVPSYHMPSVIYA